MERPPAQEPLVYMPTLPATADEAMGKVPLAPDCTATRVTGARQGGWLAVAVYDGETVGVEVMLDVLVRVAEELDVLVCEVVTELVCVELKEPVPVGMGDGVGVEDGV